MTAAALTVLWLLILAMPPRAFAAAEPAVARFTWSGGQEPPQKLCVVPSSVRFGDVVAVVLEALPGAVLPSAEALRVDVDWLIPATKAALPDLDSLPQAAGPRLIVPMRIYHLGSWRPAWGDAEAGELLTVEGRLFGPEAIMPVRDPRTIGGIPRWLLWIFGIGAAAVILLLLRRYRTRRRSCLLLVDRPLPPPAWLEAALQLQELDRTPAVDEQAGRVFLDRLAHIMRVYVQGRFTLPGPEMTAGEIMTAARAAGWHPEQLDGFCALLAVCDHQRYAPPTVTALSCRRVLRTALDLIEDARIEPVWTPVSPSRLAESTTAWRALRTRYPRRTTPLEHAVC